MKQLLFKIRDYILKDVENEGQSNDLAVLLRVLSLLCIFHFLFLIFPIAYIGNLFVTVFLIFGIGIMLGVLICTYENRTTSGLWLYNAVFLLYAVYVSFYRMGLFFRTYDFLNNSSCIFFHSFFHQIPASLCMLLLCSDPGTCKWLSSSSFAHRAAA